VKLGLILATLTLVETYSVVYRVFENFAVGFFPEIFVILLSFMCGKELKFVTTLACTIVAPVGSFFLSQLIGYLMFNDAESVQVILLALAKGGATFGFAYLILGVVIGSISHLFFFKENGT